MRIRSVIQMARIFAVIPFVFPLTAHAGVQCQHITASGETFFNGTAFVGDVTFVIDGIELPATSSTVIVETIKTTTTGKMLLVTSHTFDFGGGATLVTRDHAILTPTGTPGLYRLHSVLTIVEGTGVYAGATGKLAGRGGTIDLIAGHAVWQSVGRLCLPTEGAAPFSASVVPVGYAAAPYSCGPGDSLVCFSLAITGQASRLGRYSAVLSHVIDPLNPLEFTGTAVFTAANGDSFHTEFKGYSAPIADRPGFGSVTVVHTIAGGTGRFVDASGSFVGLGVLNTVTLEGEGSYRGTLTH